MTAHLSWESVNDFADNTLSAAEQAHVRAHLAECEECQSQVNALRELLTIAHEAPFDVIPPVDVWTAIHHTIDNGKTVSFPAPGVRDTGVRVSRARLAAAALLLITATATVTTVVMRVHGRGGLSNDAVNLAVAPVAPANGTPNAMASGTATASEIVMLEEEYLVTATALRATLDQSRSTLAPTTIATVERNLKIIDDAIAEARDALIHDPANTALRDMLRKSHQQKIDFLRRTTTLLEQA